VETNRAKLRLLWAQKTTDAAAKIQALLTNMHIISTCLFLYFLNNPMYYFWSKKKKDQEHVGRIT